MEAATCKFYSITKKVHQHSKYRYTKLIEQNRGIWTILVHCVLGGSKPQDFQQEAKTPKVQHKHAITLNWSSSFPLLTKHNVTPFNRHYNSLFSKNAFFGLKQRKRLKLLNPFMYNSTTNTEL